MRSFSRIYKAIKLPHELCMYVCIVTWMAKALLGNGVINTPRPNTRKATLEDVSQGGIILRVARQQRFNEDAG
jgi:hypothetical protein